MWKCNLTTNIIPTSAEAFSVVETIQNLIKIQWSEFMGLIHVQSQNEHAILSETILQKKFNDKMKVLQIN